MSKYLYPGTEILKNKLDVRDSEQLHRLERILTTRRLSELELKGVTGNFDLQHLQSIHTHMFQDIYPFAGEIREEDIAKDFFTFAPTQFIIPSAHDLFSQLRKEGYLKGLALDAFAERAAYYMADINVMHPFREGNGRTQREFTRQLAKNAGYDLDWMKVDSKRIYRASVKSVSDAKELAEVIRDTLTPTEP